MFLRGGKGARYCEVVELLGLRFSFHSMYSQLFYGSNALQRVGYLYSSMLIYVFLGIESLFIARDLLITWIRWYNTHSTATFI
jgi:hypothetical protein